MEQEYEGTELPSEVTRAQVMLREHESNRDRMNQLIGLSHNEGEQIVVRVRQKVSASSVVPQVVYHNNNNSIYLYSAISPELKKSVQRRLLQHWHVFIIQC